MSGGAGRLGALGLALCVGVGCSHRAPVESRGSKLARFTAVRAEVTRRFPAGSYGGPLAEIEALRDHVHRRVPVKAGRTFGLPLTAELYVFFMDGEPGLCGTFAILMAGAAQALGYEARVRTMSRPSTKETHVATEVRLGGRWVLQDPTFNCAWTLGGRLLSMEELGAAYAAGAPVVAVGSPLPGRSLAEYPTTYASMFEGPLGVLSDDVLQVR